MKSNKALRHIILFISVGLLSLTFFGCGGGGGGGTIANPATLQIGNGQNAGPSISRVGVASKALARVETTDNPILSIYSIDGTLLETSAVTAFPVTIELTGDKKTSAEASGVLVACLSGDGKDYRTIFKLSTADLATAGAVEDAGGGTRTEDTDGSSTIVAALLEAEVSNIIGAPVKTCQELSDGAKAAVADAVSTNNTSNRVAIDDLAEGSKEAAGTSGSLVNELITLAAANTSSTTQVDTFVRTGRTSTGSEVSTSVTAKVNRARNIVRAATKLSRASRGTGSATNAQTYGRNVLSSTDSDAGKAAASADAIAAALEISKSNAASSGVKTAMQNAASTALSGTTTGGAQSVANAALDSVVNGDTSNLDSGTELDAVATIIGAGLAGSDQGSAVAKKAEAALKITLNLATDAERVLGKALETGSSNGTAVSKIVNTGIGKGLDVANAVKKAGSGSKSDIAKAIVANTQVSLNDSVTILGPKASAVSSTKKLVYTLDKLETGSGAYTYEWAAVTGATATLDGDTLIVTPTTAGSVNLSVDQKLDGTTVSSDTHRLTVSAAAPPIIILPENEISVRQGGSGELVYSAISPSTAAASSEVVIGSGSGCATSVSDLDASIAGGVITITASSAVPASPAYCAKVTATVGSASATEDIAVEVVGVIATSVSVNPVADQDENASVTVSAIALHDSQATGTLSLSVTGAGTGSNTATLSGSATTVSTTLANLAVGTYTVTATIGTATDSYTFNVNAQGAPTGLSVQLDGVGVETGDSVNKTTSGTSVTVDIDVSATGAVSYMAWSGQVSDSNSTGQNLSLVLPVGTNMVTVSASNSGGVSAQAVFDVVVNQVRDIAVTHVTLMGTIVGTTTIDAASNASGNTTVMSTSVANGAYMVNAGNITGLDLNNVQGDHLYFSIYTETPDSGDVDNHSFDIEVSMTQDNSNRLGSLEVNGATIAVDNGGWDVTAASSFFFSGRRENGDTAQVEVSSISTLDSLFMSTTNGIMLDLIGLKDAMKTIVTDAGNTAFASAFDSLSGSNITIDVTVSSPNFSFTSGGESFNTFRIWNIFVE